MIDPMEVDPYTRNMHAFLAKKGFKPSLEKQGEIYIFCVTDPQDGKLHAVRGDDLHDVSRQMEEQLYLWYVDGW